ncbi:Gfo/Idh/MocA family oxidoreductase [Amnibacterium sp. CER49]|uniref:Gfo/Idh/MocA family protein n=1 Tax=Amnibacterium sp. CER49 TaxID=3039161 RepID=UPI0024472846|nr:Gfo/Idh/MocA family oxidoreductase [Amnibacterium sp. CER49]MDH2444489.1 Gfo/Idh/MocA family oxidoreductase [Amnibacterium sp. CER49]
MAGYGFMGAAHSQGWRSAPAFFDLPAQVRMTAVAGRNQEAVSAAAAKWGWSRAETDWRALIDADDIDLIDVCTPGDSHVDIAIAALEAGKHVICEKPLANSVAEAERMADAARAAAERGVFAMVGFSYRRVPAVGLAKRLIEEGRLGRIRQVRAQYLQDWLADASAPMTWRLDKSLAGSGALGDIGAHAIDMTQYLTDSPITSVSGVLETFVTERPKLAERAGLSGRASDETGTVTVDDAALFTARFGDGALGQFEATRMATGRKNAFRFELSGERGAIAFDFEDMNVLWFYDATDPEETLGFQRILATEPSHPWVGAWWPTGHGLGYEHAFSHQIVDFVNDIAAGRPPRPSFDEGLQVQRVLAAIEESAANGSAWTTTEGIR